MRRLVRGVPSLDVERLLLLGVAKPLRLPEDARVRRVELLHLRQDVVAGPVQDPVDARKPVCDQPLAHRLYERDPAGHARLEEEVAAAAPGRREDLGAVLADQRLVRRDDDLAQGERGERDLPGDPRSAHQLADDVDPRGRSRRPSRRRSAWKPARARPGPSSGS